MTFCMDTKISFFSGSFLTLAISAPLYEMWIALLLGLIGGLGGVLGKELYYLMKKLLTGKGK